MTAATTPDSGRIADEARRRGLRRMRGLALGLLALAVLAYALTRDQDGFLGFVNAAAEAAMVGAIADWFAVTALFRHPLGLPVPHTAIIPTRKDALGRSLQAFVTDNFLAEPVVRARLADAQVSLRAGLWLADPAHSEVVVREAARVTRRALLAVRDADVEALVRDGLLPRVAEEPLSPVTGRLLEQVLRDGAHHSLVDLVLTEAHAWLVENGETVTEVVGARAPWWTPVWLDERVSVRVHAEAVAWVAEIKDDREHRARKAIDDLLAKLAHDLQHDPDMVERAESFKRRMLAQPQVVTTSVGLWNVLRRALAETLDDPESPVRAKAADELTAFGHRLVSDEPLRARLDAYAADAATYLVRTYGAELTRVITDTVERWDGQEAARRIELHVGRDLQFIRINGTLVGGLVGVLIHTVAVLT
ncbi:MAG TPA: DUF445 domain-containing protein [Nocardioidaceae bacterium]|nr:DUF445 domain-containing protein [Nocardioidaceae bacterium]